MLKRSFPLLMILIWLLMSLGAILMSAAGITSWQTAWMFTADAGFSLALVYLLIISGMSAPSPKNILLVWVFSTLGAFLAAGIAGYDSIRAVQFSYNQALAFVAMNWFLIRPRILRRVNVG